MTARITNLYPPPQSDVPLAGAYLAHALHRRGTPQAPFVFADFVSSLDGRIAVKELGGTSSRIPAGLSSSGDFRLLQELQAQADCLITHAGYLRAIAAGRLGDILQVGSGRDAQDLAAWRKREGLAPQPAIAIASTSFDFEIPQSVVNSGQQVILATGAATPEDKLRAWSERGYRVFRAGAGNSVEGKPVTQALGELGFRSIFLLAGPRMLETMLRDRMLGRLYLTLVHRLTGGPDFHSMIGGPELGEAGRLKLVSLYQHTKESEGAGQWFAAC